ncbi:MAG: elongation factor P [Candidatus Dojkabacteria bacterium]|nr:MAG: elongation factor P [Candidatus Dojkabacteria bacterium]
MAMTDNLVKGIYLMIDGNIHLVVERKYKTQGRQGGLIILEMKNLSNGHNVSKTVKAGTKFETVTPEHKEMQYLYKDDESCYFMDTGSFETIAVAADFVGDYAQFMKEGDKYVVQFYENKPLSIRTNPTVELKVTESVDAVRGNTANAATKLVTTETGYRVAVPLFVNQGDTIYINTETGEYTGRV